MEILRVPDRLGQHSKDGEKQKKRKKSKRAKGSWGQDKKPCMYSTVVV